MLQPKICALSGVVITKAIDVRTQEESKDVIRTYQAESILSYLESIRQRIDPINGQTILGMSTEHTSYSERIDACMDFPLSSRRHTVQYDASTPSVSSRTDATPSYRSLADIGGELKRSPSDLSLDAPQDKLANWNELGSGQSSPRSNGSGGGFN
jgi:hypothetical protein